MAKLSDADRNRLAGIVDQFVVPAPPLFKLKLCLFSASDDSLFLMDVEIPVSPVIGMRIEGFEIRRLCCDRGVSGAFEASAYCIPGDGWIVSAKFLIENGWRVEDADSSDPTDECLEFLDWDD